MMYYILYVKSELFQGSVVLLELCQELRSEPGDHVPQLQVLAQHGLKQPVQAVEALQQDLVTTLQRLR